MNWKQAARIFRHRWLSFAAMYEDQEDEILSLKDRLMAAMLERDAYKIELDETRAILQAILETPRPTDS